MTVAGDSYGGFQINTSNQIVSNSEFGIIKELINDWFSVASNVDQMLWLSEVTESKLSPS